MTIILGNSTYTLKNFMYQRVEMTENFVILSSASNFLTEWISGVKVFSLFTSGSTGEPKPIQLKRKWLETSALQTIQILGLWNENILCCLPTNKIGGLMMIVRALAGGFDLKIIEPKSDPMEDLEPNHNYSFVSLVPAQLHHILNSEESTIKFNRFKTVLIGGAEINDALLIKIKALKPHIYHTYGMTETCSHIALKKLNHQPQLNFTPLPFVEVKLNEQGCLAIKAYQTGDNWIETNDLAQIYEDGSFKIMGRKDFTINTGGFKVQPELLEKEIQNLLQLESTDGILAISSHKSDKWGEELVLVLKESFSLSKDVIFNTLNNSLPNHQLPRKIIRFNEFPITENGKLERYRLKELVAAIG